MEEGRGGGGEGEGLGRWKRDGAVEGKEGRWRRVRREREKKEGRREWRGSGMPQGEGKGSSNFLAEDNALLMLPKAGKQENGKQVGGGERRRGRRRGRIRLA
eukprot:73475-Hanusia_phi.AAC.1